jgi:hypothetical protein
MIRLVRLNLNNPDLELDRAIGAVRQFHGFVSIILPNDPLEFRRDNVRQAVLNWAYEASKWIYRKAELLMDVADKAGSDLRNRPAIEAVKDWFYKAVAAGDGNDDVEDE